MHEKFDDKLTLPEVPFGLPTLSYEKPELGVNYWIIDDFFEHAKAVEISNRCFNKSKWILGKPYTKELWPGMRTKKALKSNELDQVEAWVKAQINKQTLWVEESKKVVVNSNWAILVGADEGEARPHVDNRQLCEYGAVLYLSQNPKPDSGTSFYRLKYQNGAAGGNIVKDPYQNLVDSLKTDSLPPDSWYKDIDIENKFNRLILFKGNMVHSASSYFGKEKRDKRLAVTFFWRTK